MEDNQQKLTEFKDSQETHHQSFETLGGEMDQTNLKMIPYALNLMEVIEFTKLNAASHSKSWQHHLIFPLILKNLNIKY